MNSFEKCLKCKLQNVVPWISNLSILIQNFAKVMQKPWNKYDANLKIVKGCHVILLV